MDEITLPQEQKFINRKICVSPGCMHAGQPQPAKYFKGKKGELYDLCSDCRLGPWGRSNRDRKTEYRNRKFGRMVAPRQHPFIMPPGCEAVAGEMVEMVDWILGRCPEGEGLPVLADPQGRPIIKPVGARRGEVCLVIR